MIVGHYREIHAIGARISYESFTCNSSNSVLWSVSDWVERLVFGKARLAHCTGRSRPSAEVRRRDRTVIKRSSALSP